MTAADPGVVDSLEARLRRLTPETARRWGTMTASEMVCHLSDSFLALLGERPVSAAAWPRWRQRLTKWIAFRTPLPWPQGIATMPEVNPKLQGTRPAAFEADRDALLVLMRRFVSPSTRYAPHPMFGMLTRDEALIWTFRHVDHHLRQFGL